MAIVKVMEPKPTPTARSFTRVCGTTTNPNRTYYTLEYLHAIFIKTSPKQTKSIFLLDISFIILTCFAIKMYRALLPLRHLPLLLLPLLLLLLFLLLLHSSLFYFLIGL